MALHVRCIVGCSILQHLQRKEVLVKGTELPAPDTTVAYWDWESWTKLEHSVSLQRHLRRLGCGFWNVDSLTATSFKWSTLWKSPAFTVISFTTLFKRVDGPKRATCRCLRFEAQGPFILEHKLPYGGQLLLSRVPSLAPHSPFSPERWEHNIRHGIILRSPPLAATDLRP